MAYELGTTSAQFMAHYFCWEFDAWHSKNPYSVLCKLLTLKSKYHTTCAQNPMCRIGYDFAKHTMYSLFMVVLK